MEKSNRFVRKLKSLFWMFLSGLPIFYLLFFILINTFNMNSSLMTSSNYMQEFSNLITFNQVGCPFQFLYNNYISQAFQEFINIMLDSNLVGSNMEICVCDIISWYIIIAIVHFAVDLLMWPFNFGKNFVDRKVGDVE